MASGPRPRPGTMPGAPDYVPGGGSFGPGADDGIPGVPAYFAGAADDVPGEERVTVDGVTFERGATIILRPGTDRDFYDRMLDGRRATVERIYLDYDDRIYLGVTVDDDPGQELLRETGRYLFFFVNEVEAP